MLIINIVKVELLHGLVLQQVLHKRRIGWDTYPSGVHESWVAGKPDDNHLPSLGGGYDNWHLQLPPASPTGQ